MTTSRTNTAKITAPRIGVELGDLRWLVQQLEGAPDEDRVTVSVSEGFSQMDPGEIVITANVPDRPVRPNATYPPGVRRPIADAPQA